MIKRYALVVSALLLSAACAAGDSTSKKHNYVKSDQIAIQLLPYQDDPNNFLRFSSNRIDRDIRLSVKLEVKNVKLVEISDLYADEERCAYRHSAKAVYLYFDPPINTDEIITTISKPCIFEHNARLKLKVATEQQEFLYRTYTFPVHPLSNFY